MKKPTIFYFVHAHGNGHKATFSMLYPAFSAFFTIIAITTNQEVTQHLIDRYCDIEVLELPSKYPHDYPIPEHTFSKPFEVTPYATEPAARVKLLAEAVLKHQPKAFYCDGNPELAIIIRGIGVPIVLVHLPGNRMHDPTQVFAYELADHIVAHFPSTVEQRDYRYLNKTFYSGYMSRYAGLSLKPISDTDKDKITIILGYDNYDASVLAKMTGDLNTDFTIIGNRETYALGKNCILLGNVNDVREAITGDIVISAAGQNIVAEILSLGKRLILLPEQRPYDEQAVHANILADHSIVILVQESASAEKWQHIITKAKALKPVHQNLVNSLAPVEIAQKMKNWYA